MNHSFGMQVRAAYSMLLIAAVMMGTGCVTTYEDQRTRRAVQEREDILLVQEDLQRLSGRLEGLEMELEQLRRDMERQRADQTQRVQTEAQERETGLATLDRRIQEVDRARERDKKEIVDQLSATVEQLIVSQPTARRSSGGTSHSGYGYEHEVGPGETLSHIAAAYGVSTRVIIDENNLQNPDRLQIGQVLFIPE